MHMSGAFSRYFQFNFCTYLLAAGVNCSDVADVHQATANYGSVSVRPLDVHHDLSNRFSVHDSTSCVGSPSGGVLDVWRLTATTRRPRSKVQYTRK